MSKAIHRNRSQPHVRYFQLATVNSEGYPANRTVVFRGFLDDEQNSLKIVTDVRSAKIQDIEYQAYAEVCWYFTKTREQFRIRGNLRLVDVQEVDQNLQLARINTWQNLSEVARSQFAWADPGKPLEEETAFDPSLPCLDNPLDNFCLLLLIPKKIDYLQLKGSPHQRCLYTLESDLTWSIQSLNP